ncbi:hypothetical protein NIES4075_72910 [Tolypothrix sp. NIES-4075]|uniref:hypothetical protein n=1 Tax=Tolypothrix sp. NIES-4075 TaxID=2005459 RepID=UPI000B6D3293|nr:hypothetical protein [Tolypothrix sp. NIES-4075]GAX46270.1 hypothetical protein NIES4075_72910 [Tolypothrix sp. NIES-4075]
MEVKNGRKRTSQVGERSEGSKFEGQPRSMGAFPATSSGNGSYQVRTSGEDSNESNTPIAGEHAANQVTGKFVSQLIDETEKQLAYYEEQAELLRNRLEELRRIPENLLDTEQNE